MTSTTIDMQVKTYIAAIAARLADLPPDERDDLMADLEQHLHELAAEGEGTLTERLGTPEAYAAELRASAGLPERSSRHVVADATKRLRELPVLKEARSFLPELRPAWWVLRAFIVAAAMIRLWTSFGGTSGKYIWLGLGEVHVVFFGALAAIVLAVPSVLLGRAAMDNRAARWVSIIGNIPTIIVGLLLLGNAYPATAMYGLPEAYDVPAMTEYLHHEDGTGINNICAYTTKLELIDGVLLFDQDGRPIDNPASLFDGAAVQPRGRGFANFYPRKYLTYDDMGAEEEVPFECPSLAKTAKEKTAKEQKEARTGPDD